MKEQNRVSESTSATEKLTQGQNDRRKFIKKYGKLAAVTPVAVSVLMSTHSSKALASNNGNGNDNGNGVGWGPGGKPKD